MLAMVLDGTLPSNSFPEAYNIFIIFYLGSSKSWTKAICQQYMEIVF